MEKKYWVPALEKADGILKLLASRPYEYRLIDLSSMLNIHKSSMYSILNTMETIHWIVRSSRDTYALGPVLTQWSSSSSLQPDIVSSFYREAAESKELLQETIQLALLDGADVIYLAKVEAPTMVRLASSPGMKFPAHATALGKAMLARLTDEQLNALYPESELRGLTEFSLKTKDELIRQMRAIRSNGGLALDRHEAIVGFCCVAASIRGGKGRGPLLAVSCTMTEHEWERKKEIAMQEIVRLAERLSEI